MFQDIHKSTLLSYLEKPISLVLWLLSVIYVFADGTIEFEEITVMPSQFTIREGTRSSLSLSKREVDFYPLIDNDIMRAAHIFPGVVSSDFSARFSVRGGEKDEILVRLDGMELFDPYHLQDFGGAISIIDLGLVARADLLMGGFPAEFGDKMSGVFDITSREGDGEQVSVNFGLDFINTHVLIEGPLSDKGSWLLSARRGYIDLILGLMDTDEDLNPRYTDLFGKLVYNLTDQDKLIINSFYAWDRNLIKDDDPKHNLDSDYGNGMLWTKWKHSFSQSVWSNLYFFNGQANRNRLAGVGGIDQRDFSFFGTKGEFVARMLGSHTVRCGLEWRWSEVEYNYASMTGSDYVVRPLGAEIEEYQGIETEINDNGSRIKAYVQDEWKLHPIVSVNFGARYLIQDYRPFGTRQHEVSPRVALAIKLRENLVLRGAWGIYHQPIDLMTIPVEDNTRDFDGAQVATHYVLGTEFTSGRQFIIQAEVYYKKLGNLSGQIRDFGRKTQIFSNPESGYVNGFDIFVSQAISDQLTWSLGYAYALAKEKLGHQEFYRKSDQRHSIALNSSYEFLSRWYLHCSWRFNTGRSATKLIHYSNKSFAGVECNRHFGDYNGYRLPTYHSLDMRVTKSSTFRNWDLNWYFQVLNLYWRKNVHEYAFKEIRNKITNEVEGCEVISELLLPLVPTVGATIRF